MSNSLKVTSSASVFRTPMVPQRVGLLRRVVKDPSLSAHGELQCPSSNSQVIFPTVHQLLNASD